MNTSRVLFIPVIGEIQSFYPKDETELHNLITRLMGSVELDSFRGEFANYIGLFFCDDRGHEKNLPINKRATEAYLKRCIPGTTHTIVGPVVGLFGRYAAR